MGAGSGAGRAAFQDISLTKWVDKASPKLMETSFLGKHITKGKLVVRKAGGKQLDYIIYELKDIIVTSVSTGGSGGEDRLTENIALNFGSFKFQYIPQKADGTGDKPIETKYDIAAQESNF